MLFSCLNEFLRSNCGEVEVLRNCGNLARPQIEVFSLWIPSSRVSLTEITEVLKLTVLHLKFTSERTWQNLVDVLMQLCSCLVI